MMFALRRWPPCKDKRQLMRTKASVSYSWPRILDDTLPDGRVSAFRLVALIALWFCRWFLFTGRFLRRLFWKFLRGVHVGRFFRSCHGHFKTLIIDLDVRFDFVVND